MVYCNYLTLLCNGLYYYTIIVFGMFSACCRFKRWLFPLSFLCKFIKEAKRLLIIDCVAGRYCKTANICMLEFSQANVMRFVNFSSMQICSQLPVSFFIFLIGPLLQEIWSKMYSKVSTPDSRAYVNTVS